MRGGGGGPRLSPSRHAPPRPVSATEVLIMVEKPTVAISEALDKVSPEIHDLDLDQPPCSFAQEWCGIFLTHAGLGSN